MRSQRLVRRVWPSERVAEVGLKGKSIVGAWIIEIRDKNTGKVIYEDIKTTKK